MQLDMREAVADRVAVIRQRRRTAVAIDSRKSAADIDQFRLQARGLHDIAHNAERAAINAPLQGTAADIMKRAMIALRPALAESGLGARMLLQVHDELLFEVPVKEKAETEELVKKIMESAGMGIGVPLHVEAGWGNNWADAH